MMRAVPLEHMSLNEEADGMETECFFFKKFSVRREQGVITYIAKCVLITFKM